MTTTITPSRRSSNTSILDPTPPISATANTSTSSLTLINTLSTSNSIESLSLPTSHLFSPPPRTSTSSSTSSNNTITTTYTSHPSAPTTAPRNASNTHTYKSRQAKISTRQAELLRHKGTYTEAGRHSDVWLFGGWSFTNSVKGAWKAVRG